MKYKSYLLDLINFFVGFIPIGFAYSLTIFWATQFFNTHLFLPFLFLLLPIVSLVYIFALWAVRLCIPKLVEGSYPLSLNKGFFAWTCHRALYRSTEMSMLKKFIMNFNILKHLLFKALGADIAFGINIALDADIYDYQLIKIGKDVTIGARTMMSCHNFIGKKLILKKVCIGDNVLVGYDTAIAPGSVIEDNAWVGSYNIINGETIKSESGLLSGEWRTGSPETQEKLRKLKEKLSPSAR